jgi:hypothetical protein
MIFPFNKTPEQTVVGVGIDFANEFAPGEVVSTFSVTDGGTGVVADSRKDGTVVLATFTGGAPGQTVDIIYAATGDQGSHYGGTIRLYITPSAALCTIVADLRDLGMQPVADVKLSVRSKYPKAVNGSLLHTAAAEALTDASGQAIVTVPQGITAEIDFQPLKARAAVDTTGKSMVRLADLFA